METDPLADAHVLDLDCGGDEDDPSAFLVSEEDDDDENTFDSPAGLHSPRLRLRRYGV